MTKSAERPRLGSAQRAPEAVSPARRRLVVVAAALTGAAAMVLAGLWGWQADRSANQHTATAPAGWSPIPGGWLAVRQVSDRAVNHKGMPGMQMMPDPDPVPAGYVRLTVDLSLAARGETLRWQPRDFTVEGNGVGVVRPHRAQLGDGVVPEGSQVAGGLTFEVPKTAKHLTLQFRDGGSIPLAVPISRHSPSGASSGASPDDQHDD
jgi:hypothetical protein